MQEQWGSNSWRVYLQSLVRQLCDRELLLLLPPLANEIGKSRFVILLVHSHLRWFLLQGNLLLSLKLTSPERGLLRLGLIPEHAAGGSDSLK